MLGINNFDDLKKRARIFLIDVFIIIVAFIVLVVSCSEKDESPAAPVSDDAIGNAKIACVERYHDAAIYDSNICASCIQVKSSPAELLPMFDYWLVYIEGEMKNKFGHWEENKAECRVDKNTHQMLSFTFPNQFGPLKSHPPIYKPSMEFEIK